MTLTRAVDTSLTDITALAEAAAGPPAHLVHRALSYHAVYVASHRICCFALIAGHGALWANWYLRCARLAAMVFALLDLRSPLGFREKLRQFDMFTDALRDINQQVMVATYRLVHAVRLLGADAATAMDLPADLCRDYAAAFAIADQGGTVTEAAKRDLYERHFRWEQKRVVGGVLQECFDRFTWVFMRNICLRPWVWFAYFRPGNSLNFSNFLDEEERVQKGLTAYDCAQRTGWAGTERRFRLAIFCLLRRPRGSSSRRYRFPLARVSPPGYLRRWDTLPQRRANICEDTMTDQ